MENSNINTTPQNKKSILKIFLIINISFLVLITVLIVVFFTLTKKTKKKKRLKNQIQILLKRII